MRPLFMEGAQPVKRVDEGVSCLKPDGVRVVKGGRREFRPGEPLLKLPEGWFARRRAERFRTTEDAAHACGIGAKLMWILECGGVTSPEIALRGITCAGTAARRRREGFQYRVRWPDGEWTEKRSEERGRSAG